MRPPIPYTGGKTRLAKKICSLLPQHLPMYVEPFFGAGGIFFYKQKSPTEYINDLDGDVVNFYEMLRDYPEDLRVKCEYTPYARELYYQVVNAKLPKMDTLQNKLIRAWRFWVVARQGRVTHFAGWDGRERETRPHSNKATGIVNETRPGGWRVPERPGGSSKANEMAKTARSRFQEIHERLQGVTIDNRDAITIIKRYDRTHSLLYCDPPYVRDTRHESLFKHEMTDEQHIELLETVRKYSGLVAISGYRNDIYDELLADWRAVEIDVNVPVSPIEKKMATEVLWMNYDDFFQPLARV